MGNPSQVLREAWRWGASEQWCRVEKGRAVGKYHLQCVTCIDLGWRGWNREESRWCSPVLAGDLLARELFEV